MDDICASPLYKEDKYFSKISFFKACIFRLPRNFANNTTCQGE